MYLQYEYKYGSVNGCFLFNCFKNLLVIELMQPTMFNYAKIVTDIFIT